MRAGPALTFVSFVLFAAAASVGTARSASAAEHVCDRAELARLDRAVADNGAAMRRWYYGWSGAFLVAGLGQEAFAGYTHDAGLAIDSRVGAFMAGLGWAATVALPPPTLFATASDLDAIGPTQLQSACRSRAKLLASAADDEAFGTGWLAHSAGWIANVAAGIWLWRRHDRLGAGILQTVEGLVVSELQIWTRPRSASAAMRTIVSPTLVPGGAALSVGFVF
jgi:hypothetical protein